MVEVMARVQTLMVLLLIRGLRCMIVVSLLLLYLLLVLLLLCLQLLVLVLLLKLHVLLLRVLLEQVHVHLTCGGEQMLECIVRISLSPIVLAVQVVVQKAVTVALKGNDLGTGIISSAR